MALVNKTFSVNITPGMMPPIVHVSEYDVGRAYTVSILDEQGNTFTIPSGTTASIEGTLNGSVGFTKSATVSNNQVSFTLSQDMTAYSGKAWCKIKLTQNSQPIQTCAFVLAVDRAGVEAETVIGAPGFEEQIIDAVNNWLDLHPPSGGTGLSDDAKQALLDCFENVAWINDQGQTYYDALYAALYPPKTLVSISAAFNQGSAVIYDTDSLDTLKQYLTVTATYDDSSTGVVTGYTLSGTLTEGTSTITVSYDGKSTTFTVTVTDAGNAIYILRSPFVSTGTEKIDTGVKFESGNTYTILGEFVATADTARASFLFSNKIVGNNTYCGLHLQKQNESYPRYMWGAGISYGNGENKYVLDTIIRFAVIVEVDLAKCTMYLRNTSAAQTRNFTNTYTVPSFVNDTAIYLGNETGGNGFNGTVNKFVIESGIKPISEINAFLEASA